MIATFQYMIVNDEDSERDFRFFMKQTWFLLLSISVQNSESEKKRFDFLYLADDVWKSKFDESHQEAKYVHNIL